MNNPQIILVTGTDTAVGKTYVTALCLAGLKREYPDCRIKVIKPVETGCEVKNQQLVPADGLLLQQAGSAQQDLNEIVPFRMRLPLAPEVAAAYEKQTLVWSEIINRIQQLSTTCDVLLVEGAGGLRVPICEGKTYLELASELNAQVLLVCANKLGVLNHAFLSFECLKHNKIGLLGYVLNQVHAPSYSDETDITATKTNVAALQDIARRFEATNLGYLRHNANFIAGSLLADKEVQSFIAAVAFNLKLHPAIEAACQR